MRIFKVSFIKTAIYLQSEALWFLTELLERRLFAAGRVVLVPFWGIKWNELSIETQGESESEIVRKISLGVVSQRWKKRWLFLFWFMNTYSYDGKHQEPHTHQRNRLVSVESVFYISYREHQILSSFFDRIACLSFGSRQRLCAHLPRLEELPCRRVPLSLERCQALYQYY